MSLSLTKNEKIYKRLFTLKPPQRNGLLLNIHHTEKNSQEIRFILASFSKNGQILVSADRSGNIFVIDFPNNKFWNIPTDLNSCTIIKFSNYKESEIIVASNHGQLRLIDIENGFIIGELQGHQSPVSSITFSRNFCLTASEQEAIVWNLTTNTKVQVLNLETSSSLKHVAFMPVSSNIFTCYDDNIVQIWQNGTFDIKTELHPLIWYNHPVKCATFSMDGKTMVMGLHPCYLALFLLSNFKLLKFITLPEYIPTIRHIDFIPSPNDGGCNKIIAILSGRGTIYFYDLQQNLILSELAANSEISKFHCPGSGDYIACVLCSGAVNVYNITQYIVQPLKVSVMRVNKGVDKKSRLKKCLAQMGMVKEQIRDILDIDKLRLILRDCGEFPEMYRTKIWEQVLALPNEQQQYNAVINNRMIVAFDDLERKYPLENKRYLKNLKKLLDNLVTWCSFFLHVDYLPLLVFPFVKVFHNKPLTCFEAVCTIILNWCQFWFEYFPLPPLNVLAIIENLLMEHDAELLNCFIANNISSKVYAWPLLRSAFSEVLTAENWRVLWDHVLTNEPGFLLCAVVAYNISFRTTVMSFVEEKEFVFFYHTHHAVDVKRLVQKTYHILNNTSKKIHPRQYLNMFKKMEAGKYPTFCDYPKTMIDFKSEKSEQLKGEMLKLKNEELDLFKDQIERLNRFEKMGLKDEENRRILEAEAALKKNLRNEQEEVRNYQQRLSELRRKFHEENLALSHLQEKLGQKAGREMRGQLFNSLAEDVKLNRAEKDYTMRKLEDELLFNYSELLRNKHRIEHLLDEESTQESASIFNRHQEELNGEIDRVSRMSNSEEHLKMLNFVTGVTAADALIKKIESELERENHGGNSNETSANERVLKLQAETRDLVAHINYLRQLLAETPKRDDYTTTTSSQGTNSGSR